MKEYLAASCSAGLLEVVWQEIMVYAMGYNNDLITRIVVKRTKDFWWEGELWIDADAEREELLANLSQRSHVRKAKR